MSLMAKVSPARVCLAAGGGGWGNGRIWNLWTKAPKSSLNLAFRLRVSAAATIPTATVTPITNTHTFGFFMFAFTVFMLDRMQEND